VAPPAPSDWRTVTAQRDEYLHVSVSGRFLNDRETYVRAVTDLGAGYWVLTPFQTDVGYTVLVNRGFVPPELRAPASRAAGQVHGETTISGLLRMWEPRGGFLRANDPLHDRWYSRDVAAIASLRGLRAVAPYFIDAAAAPSATGWPRGGLTVISFPNNHLMYAFTWFGLALLLAIRVFASWNAETRPARLSS
jgi:surfeit locus 1 family protein